MSYTPEDAPSPDAPTETTADELLNSGLVGIWADRSDIGDSTEFARQLHYEAEHRIRNDHDIYEIG